MPSDQRQPEMYPLDPVDVPYADLYYGSLTETQRGWVRSFLRVLAVGPAVPGPPPTPPPVPPAPHGPGLRLVRPRGDVALVLALSLLL